MNITEATRQIIALAKEFKLFTKTDTSGKVIRRFEEENAPVQIILSSGEPPGTKQCSRCKEILKTSEFSYYQTRVDSKGYLMRSNALCSQCAGESNRARRQVLDKSVSPPKPGPGDRCPNCRRAWSGNWHRHHDPETEEFVAWWCSNCNMARQDQRNPNVYREKGDG